jgi:hypothetical protein
MLSTGLLVVIGVFVLGFLGVALGLKTRAGSEIGRHPSDGMSHTGGTAAPLASESDEPVRREEGGLDPFDTHGTE